MKKFVALGAGLVLGVAVIYYVFSGSVVTVNGVDYDTDSLVVDFNKNLASTSPVFEQEELNEFVTYSFDIDSINTRGFVTKLADKVRGTNYSVQFTYDVDTDSVRDWIDKYNQNATKTKNARIVKGKKRYKISEEVLGTKIDFNQVEEHLNNKEYNIDVESCTKQPKIVSDDLEDKVNELNTYVSWSYTYDNGKSVKSGIDNVTLTKRGKIKLDDTWIDDEVKNAVSSYNTVGITRKFKTHGGSKIKVSGGTWGSEVNYEAEIAKVKKAFNLGKSKTDKVPEYLSQREEIGDTYAEVSISDQHVWFYKNGKCVMDTSCVTGTRGVHDTPKGIYYIMERINGKYLTGADYKTWVNKWMRLTWSGVGLHDATWRGSFGGSIYTYSGSHGCINLPYSFASQLYDKVYVDMPVIIY